MKREIAVIGSDFINALSIYKSLKESNFNGDIYALTSKKYKLLSKVYKDDVISKKLEKVEDIIPFILSLDKKSKKYLFLTNEIYHSILYENKQNLIKNNVTFYFGNIDPNEIIDKSKFASIFDNDTIAATPKIFNFNDTINQSVIVKFKNSYINGKKTLPVKIIDDNKELKLYIKFIKDNGFNQNDLIVQEKLSSKCKDNISIVGWYDNEKQQYFQTRKLLQHPKEGGTGDLVEMIPLDENFKVRARHILDKINYKGPFEIEFIKDLSKSGNYKLLEINPRFWMQNGLISVNSGNALINSFLSKKNNKVIKNKRYWVNLPHYLKSLLLFEKEAWYYLPKIIFKTYSPVSFNDLLLYLVRK